MTLAGKQSATATAKMMAIKAIIKETRPHLVDIEITVEESHSFKPPPGFGWSKTGDPKLAIHGVTKRLHVISPPGSSSDVYYYK